MNLSKEYMKRKFSIYIINYNNLWIIKFNKKKYIYNVQLYDIFNYTYNIIDLGRIKNILQKMKLRVLLLINK